MQIGCIKSLFELVAPALTQSALPPLCVMHLCSKQGRTALTGLCACPHHPHHPLQTDPFLVSFIFLSFVIPLFYISSPFCSLSLFVVVIFSWPMSSPDVDSRPSGLGHPVPPFIRIAATLISVPSWVFLRVHYCRLNSLLLLIPFPPSSFLVHNSSNSTRSVFLTYNQ